MKAFNKFIFLLVFILFSFIFFTGTTKTGAKISLNQSVLKNTVKRFSKYIVEELYDFKIPDQKFEVNVGIGKLKIFLNGISISFKIFPIDNLKIDFVDPNAIQVSINDVDLEGGFKAQLKLGFLKDTLPTEIKIKKFKLFTNIVLDREASKGDKTKFLPTVDVTKLDIDFDIDFKIKTFFIGNIVKVFKGLIKKKIKSEILDQVCGKLRKDIKNIISEQMNNLSVTPRIYEDIHLDYTLLDSPQIKSGSLILNTKAQLYDTKYPKTLNPPFDLVDIDAKIGTLNKEIEVILSEYTINSSLYTFVLSQKLNVKLTNNELPSDSPFHLTSTSLSAILSGILEKYGKDKELYLMLRGTEPVNGVNLKNGKIVTEAAALCEFHLVGEKNPIVILKIIIAADVNASLKENAELSVSINKALINDLSIISTTLPDLKVDATKALINFAVSLCIPIINKEILSKIDINFPEYLGIKFTSSVLKIHDDYIEVGVTPEFTFPERNYLSKINNFSSYLDFNVVNNNIKDDEDIDCIKEDEFTLIGDNDVIKAFMEYENDESINYLE